MKSIRSVFVAVSACVIFAVFANRQSSRLITGAWGLGHGATHLGLALLLAWSVNQRFGIQPMSFALWGSIVVLGGLAGGTLIGTYLVISDRFFGWHGNEVFAVQSIIDYRNFVRMHILPNGSLEIFPIGLRRVPRKWRSRTKRTDDQPYYEPVDDVLAPHLIEGPIRLPP